jgi:hypothetical protein
MSGLAEAVGYVPLTATCPCVFIAHPATQRCSTPVSTPSAASACEQAPKTLHE